VILAHFDVFKSKEDNTRRASGNEGVYPSHLPLHSRLSVLPGAPQPLNSSHAMPTSFTTLLRQRHPPLEQDSLARSSPAASYLQVLLRRAAF
jgi:hypothetical protein